LPLFPAAPSRSRARSMVRAGATRSSAGSAPSASKAARSSRVNGHVTSAIVSLLRGIVPMDHQDHAGSSRRPTDHPQLRPTVSQAHGPQEQICRVASPSSAARMSGASAGSSRATQRAQKARP
jgi:hypothetical protein